MQLKDIVASLLELWNLMDSSKEERSNFSRVTRIFGISEAEITEPGVLSTEIIEQVECQSPHLILIFCKLNIKFLVISLTGICRSGETR